MKINKSIILKTLSLNMRNNNLTLFKLLENNKLDHIIDDLINYKQFIIVMNEFVIYFEKSFKLLSMKDSFLALLFLDKKPYFLFENKKYYKNKSFYENEFKKFIVENMYIAINHIYKYNKFFFTEVGITDKMSLTKSDDVDILYNFMTKFVMCNYNDARVICLFTNYDYNDLIFKKNLLKILDQWRIMINRYNKNILIVEKIMNSKK